MASVLVVAEKPSIARAMVRAFEIEKGLKFKREKGQTRYTGIYRAKVGENSNLSFQLPEGEANLGPGDQFLITSVLGHVLQFEFQSPYDKKTNWQETNPKDIIDQDPIQIPIDDRIVKQLQDVGEQIRYLAIGTDWDSHGESIGMQIVETITGVNSQVKIGRLRFTATFPKAIVQAFENQAAIDTSIVAQVDTLRKQDLRMGAVLTRYFTVGIQSRNIPNRLISYGPCQSSVLHIITKRFHEKQKFVPQPFWTLNAVYSENEEEFYFHWDKGPAFDEVIIDDLISTLGSNPQGVVEKIEFGSEEISRPLPLDTDTLESEGSRLFRVSPKVIADIAERLYNAGIITYPRTESSYYTQKDLSKTISLFLKHPEFGKIANECLGANPKNPTKGRYTKDHEPIYPVKSVNEEDLGKIFRKKSRTVGIAWLIYRYIVLRFLATVHYDCTAKTTLINLNVKNEIFSGNGKEIVDAGYLDFFPYRYIKTQIPPDLKEGESIELKIEKNQDYTKADPLWTESALIREMARLAIGTDATRASHIDVVQKRGFVNFRGNRRGLAPTPLGESLFCAFVNSGAEELINPEIRSRVEAWTQEVCEGKLSSEEVDKRVGKLTHEGLDKLRKIEDKIFDDLAEAVVYSTQDGIKLGKCPKCRSGDLILHRSSKGKRFLSCSEENCENTYSLPQRGILNVLDFHCPVCNAQPLRVSTGTKAWLFCPGCWIERSAEGEIPMFCSRCQEDCPYVGRPATMDRGKLGHCPDCGENIILTIESARTNVTCQGCKRVWKAPNIRRGSQITLDAPCRLCGNRTFQVRRKGKGGYNMCVICSRFCFECEYRCFD